MAGPNQPYTQLDQQQIIQQCFDESQDRLRVDAEISSSIIAPPGLEVSISAVDDNIAIRNSNNSNELLINPDGSINATSVISGSPNVNLQQVGGVATAVNNGTANNGTQRVVIASDNTPFTVDIGNFPSTFGVTQSTSPWIISGSVSISNFPSTQNVNVTNPTLAVTQSGTWTVGLTTESIEIGTVDQGNPNTIGNAWPILITDGINTALVTASNALKVDGSAVIQPVSGTVAVTQSTSPWVVSGTISVNPITFASPQHVIVDSGTLTANIGTTGGLALDSSLSTINTTLGSPFQSGGSIGNTSFGASQVGTWNINNISGTISLPTGAATSANQTNASQKTQIVDGSGNVIASTSNALNVDITNFPATVAVTQSTNPWVISGTVTANAGTGNFTVVQSSGANLHVNVDNFPTDLDAYAQSSTTSGQLGTLIMGAVTTNAPSYTTAQTNPLSLDTSGLLRISLKDTPANTNKFLVTADPITFSSPQHIILDSGTLTTITNPVSVTQSTSPWVISGTVAATQSGTWSTRTQDGSGTSITSTGSALDVNLKTSSITLPISGTVNTIPSFKTTYSAAVLGLTPALLATDIFTITGSGTKTVKITKLGFSAIETTAVVRDLILIKRSTANSGGTSSSITAISHDSSDPAATATVLSYTANPTLGTLVGRLRTIKVDVEGNSINGSTDYIELIFGNDLSKPITLRGTGEVLAINMNGITLTGSSIDIYIEWTEE